MKQINCEFPVQGESIPIVPSYKYFGCEIDEFLELNLMLEKRVESGKAALNGWLQRCRSAVGEVHVGTFRKLMESMVHSVLLYGAETWGCIRRMDSLDQLQMRWIP